MNAPSLPPQVPLRHPMTAQRGIGIVGLLSALMGMEIDPARGFEKILEEASRQQMDLRREEVTIRQKLVEKLRPKSKGGTGSCEECGKKISANKSHCFAHTPDETVEELTALFEAGRRSIELNGSVPMSDVFADLKALDAVASDRLVSDKA